MKKHISILMWCVICLFKRTLVLRCGELSFFLFQLIFFFYYLVMHTLARNRIPDLVLKCGEFSFFLFLLIFFFYYWLYIYPPESNYWLPAKGQQFNLIHWRAQEFNHYTTFFRKCGELSLESTCVALHICNLKSKS